MKLLSVLGCALVLGCAASQPPGMPDAAHANRTATAQTALSGRKIIYTAEVDLVVEDFASLPARIDALAEANQAFVARSDYRGSPRAPQSGQWTLRVPSPRYAELLAAIRKLGDVTRVQADAQDIGEEYIDLQSRLRTKREEEARLLALLKDATGSLSDVLAVERELMRVRGEIEQGEGRQRLLDDRVALATIVLRAQEIKDYFPEESAAYGVRAWRTLSNSLTLLGTTLQDASLVAIALLPWLSAVTLCVAAAVFLARRFRRLSDRSPSAA